MFMFHLNQQTHGIAQSHIMEEVLEIVATACLGMIIQEAEADLADNVLMEHLIQHVNLQIQHQCAHLINITVSLTM